MDLSTTIGITLGILLVAVAIILGGQPAIFLNVQGLLIVVGGTLATTLMRFPFGHLMNMLAVARNAFTNRISEPEDLIEEILQLSKQARQEGLLALEGYESEESFLNQGLQLIVDGNQPEAVDEVMSTNIAYLEWRHENGQAILKAIGDAAPAFGMIGTLIGLVIMLTNMEDVKALGPAMAVAILTTLYGALIANLIALPIAKKLELRSREETLNLEIMLAGLNGILEGENPRVIETQLQAFLADRAEARPPQPREVKVA